MKRNHRILALIAALLPLGFAPAPLAAADKEPQQAPLVEGLDDLRQLNEKLIKMAESAAPATVSLMGGQGAGSGVVVSSDGLILSAAHVVSALPEEVLVIFPDGRRARAKALGADFDRDAAMLKITDPGEYPHVDIADNTPLRINDWCVALGHPGGFDPMRTPPLRLGRVLLNSQFIITDCAVIGGDSGGPLFNADGRVVGIHSNIGLTLSQNRHVPIAVFHDQWDDLAAGKRHGKRFDTKTHAQSSPPADPDRPIFGVQLDPDADSPVKVTGVLENSPAAKAGLREGDVITQLDGEPVASRDKFIESVASLKPGRRIKLVYQRDGETIRTRAKLARYGDVVKPDPDDDGGANDGGSKDQDKTGDADKDLDSFLDKMLGKAREGELRLELTPEEIERFGGMDKIMERLHERLGKAKDGDKEPPPADKKQDGDKPQDSPKPKARKKDADKPADNAAKLLERALGNQGRLELTPEQLDQLGGLDKLLEQLKDMAGSLDPELLRQLEQQMGQAGPDEFFLSSMKALEPVAKKTAGSTVEVLVDDKPVALGTAVSADGLILTKDTETAKGKVTVRAGDITVGTTLLRRFPQQDLALFRIDAGKLRPVEWKSSPDGPPLGSLLTLTDADDQPAGIGLVSVRTRALGNVGFLGVRADQAEGGVLAAQLIKDGPAAKAGLLEGDLITKVDGKPADDAIGFTQTIRSRKAGESIRLDFLRDGKAQSIEVKLGQRELQKIPDALDKMNRMSGPMSPKTGGFPQALQHDIPIDPAQCGGPLLDLDGRCVGINVSRAGRVDTLAIPAADIISLLAEIREDGAGQPAAQDTPGSGLTPAEIEELNNTLQQIQRSLRDIEQRLNKLQAR